MSSLNENEMNENESKQMSLDIDDIKDENDVFLTGSVGEILNEAQKIAERVSKNSIFHGLPIDKISEDAELSDKFTKMFEQTLIQERGEFALIKFQSIAQYSAKTIKLINDCEIAVDDGENEFIDSYLEWRGENAEVLTKFASWLRDKDEFVISGLFFNEIGQYSQKPNLETLKNFTKRNKTPKQKEISQFVSRLVSFKNSVVCSDREGYPILVTMKPGDQKRIVYKEATSPNGKTFPEAYVFAHFIDGVDLIPFDWIVFIHAVRVAKECPLDNGKWGILIDSIIRSMDNKGENSSAAMARGELKQEIEASLMRLCYARFSTDSSDLYKKRYPGMNVNTRETNRPLLDITKEPLQLFGKIYDGYVLHQMPPIFEAQIHLNRITEVYKLMPPAMKRTKEFISLYDCMMIRLQSGLYKSPVYFFIRDGSHYPLFELSGVIEQIRSQYDSVKDKKKISKAYDRWVERVEKILDYWIKIGVIPSWDWVVDEKRRGKKIGYTVGKINLSKVKVAAEKLDKKDEIDDVIVEAVPVTNGGLPVTNEDLPVTNGGLPVTNGGERG